MKVYFLAGAQEDLRALCHYTLRNFGEEVWRDNYQKIKDSVNRLQTAPESSSTPEELADLNLSQYRQVVSGTYRIFYEIRGDTLDIHLVCDVRRDMLTLLSRRLLRSS